MGARRLREVAFPSASFSTAGHTSQQGWSSICVNFQRDGSPGGVFILDGAGTLPAPSAIELALLVQPRQY